MVNWSFPTLNDCYPRYRNIVLDFNGTMIEYSTDEVQNKAIAYAVFNEAIRDLKGGKLLAGISDIASLVKAKVEIERNLAGYKNGTNHLWDVYMPFNELVLKGRPVELIHRAIDKYVEENLDRLDKRMIRPVRKARNRGSNTGILSVSYDYAIKRFLQEAGFGNVFPDENIIANTLESEDGRAVGFTMSIYGEKGKVMEEEFLRKRDFRPWETYYSGDSPDDVPVAELLPPGHFIVPFYASDDFREQMASRYKARVPETEHDLTLILRD